MGRLEAISPGHIPGRGIHGVTSAITRYGMLIAVLLYELVVIGGIGLWLYKQRAGRAHAEGDFALGGRGLPLPVTAITLALTVLGAAVTAT